MSPLVEAMKTSASSIPASISASISSAVPIVKRPPASSHERAELDVEPLVRERVLVEDRDGVAGAAAPSVATEEPTRPAPTTRTNIGADSSERRRAIGHAVG